MKRLLGPSLGALVLGQEPRATGGGTWSGKLPTGGGTGRTGAVRRTLSLPDVFDRPGDDERPRPGERPR